jgi:peptide deformylase
VSQLELKTYPDPCLRIKTKPVDEFDDSLIDVLRAMSDVMYVNQGIGLAATQVGLGLKVMVIDAGDGLVNFINPVIMEKSAETSKMEEGCLSLPGVTVSITRPEEVKIRAQNEQGEFFIKKFEGLVSKAVQHEIDHLEGKLLIDYLNPVRYFLATRKLKREKKQ